MTFAEIPAGEAIFLDANTLVYHFASHPSFGSICTQQHRREPCACARLSCDDPHLMGIDHTRLVYRYARRDFRLTDVDGNVIKGILSGPVGRALAWRSDAIRNEAGNVSG